MSTQAGAFLPKLLEDTGLLSNSDETDEGRKKSNEELMDLNVIVVYKKLVQGLIYSPPDCDKYLALDASPLVKVLVVCWPRLHTARELWQCH